jgi:sulfur carrier protein ThiS
MQIYLGGHLNFFNRGEGSCIEVAIEGPTRLEEIIASFEIPPGEIQLVIINDELSDLDAVVTDRDIVKLYSAVGGG